MSTSSLNPTHHSITTGLSSEWCNRRSAEFTCALQTSPFSLENCYEGWIFTILKQVNQNGYFLFVILTMFWIFFCKRTSFSFFTSKPTVNNSWRTACQSFYQNYPHRWAAWAWMIRNTTCGAVLSLAMYDEWTLWQHESCKLLAFIHDLVFLKVVLFW